MGSSNIRDLLTSFSPSLDFFAISSGDGRIKIWDTVKGQLQTEFADIVSTETNGLFAKSERGHLSVDYTCMKWLSLDKKKKRKLGTSLLVLGTGSGDVLALDVSAGQMKWRASDCHPGGVSAISFPTSCSCIYTSGADGVISKLDSITGNLLGKFRASTKAISSMSVSPDGKTLATAASQLNVFNCSDYKKLQKFSGHPGSVRCMIFSDDGKSIFSSAVGERYVAVWKIDGSKKRSASSVLAMDHPAVFLDSRCIDTSHADCASICVLAISEMGICYFWHGKNVEELHNSKPTKISISLNDSLHNNHKSALPNIFAAKLQGVAQSAGGCVFLAHGLLVKPAFEKIFVESGTDIKLKSSLDGILLPISQSRKSKKSSDVQNQVTALDRANAEVALFPRPTIFDLVNRKSEAKPVVSKDDEGRVEVDAVPVCLEDKLRSVGILSNNDDLTSNSLLVSRLLKSISLEASTPQKKMRNVVLSMAANDAYELLKVFVALWQSRSCSGKHILPWICCILVNHREYALSQEPVTHLLGSLEKLTEHKKAAMHSLLQLSGRLQLVMAQIDKAANKRNGTLTVDHDEDESESEDEDEDEDADEYLYGEEDDESQNSSNIDD